MKKTILACTFGVLGLISCKKEENLTTLSTNEFISFEYNGTPYNYINSQVGDVNEPHTTWMTRIQTEGNASHFELLLADTIVGSYSPSADQVSIDFGGILYRQNGTTNPLKAVITTYDPVGGIIEGTFEGDVRQYDFYDPNITGTFTNGKFRVVRDNLHS